MFLPENPLIQRNKYSGTEFKTYSEFVYNYTVQSEVDDYDRRQWAFSKRNSAETTRMIAKPKIGGTLALFNLRA